MKKTMAAAFEMKGLNESGKFSGYASFFGQLDQGNDIVVAGAFKESLRATEEKGALIPIFWQHSERDPIGVYPVIREDEKGLYVEGELNLDVQKGKEAYSLLKQKALSGLSIGYSSTKYSIDADTGIRMLTEIKLYEASLVSFPMLDTARVSSVKSIEAILTLSDCEKLLRDAGFSKSEAVALVSRIKAVTRRDSESKEVQNAISILKGISK